MADTAIGGELLFEILGGRPLGKRRGLAHRLQRRQHFATNRLVLGFQINVGNFSHDYLLVTVAERAVVITHPDTSP